MLHLFANAFIVLFVVIDPVGLAPIFVALTGGGSQEYRRRMAVKGTLTAAGILLLFVWFGDALLGALGITLAAFRIAGGALLFFVAVDMVFARPSGARLPTPSERHEAEQKEDLSVFPLAFPLIAGPGALTTVLLQLGAGVVAHAIVSGVLILVLALTLASLLLAGQIVRVIGETGANVIGRLLGVLLAALAVQFVLDGLHSEFIKSAIVGLGY